MVMEKKISTSPLSQATKCFFFLLVIQCPLEIMVNEKEYPAFHPLNRGENRIQREIGKISDQWRPPEAKPAHRFSGG